MFSIVIIKPDGYNKKEEILKYFIGYDIEILADPVMLTKTIAKEFYSIHKDKPFYNALIDFMISGPVLILKIIGDDNIIKSVRNIIQNQIRPKYATDATANAIHASDSFQSAKTEYDIIKKYILDRYVLENSIDTLLTNLIQELKTI